jgi:hypothetical protein
MEMRNSFIWAATLAVGITLANPGPGERLGTAAFSAPPVGAGLLVPVPKQVTVPAGTRILIRTIDPIDSRKQQAGYRFTATLETNLQVGRTVVAPRGTKIYGHLTQASSAGRMKGSSQLTLELTDIVINGTAHRLLTSTFEMKGQGEGKKTAGKVVGGAGLCALIGGIAGGGSGALIGLGAGAAGGTVMAGSKKGQQLSIPSESVLEFQLQEAASLPVAQ